MHNANRIRAASGVDFGCRNPIQRHPEAVVRIEAPNPHYVQDIDTPAAYETWMQSFAPPDRDIALARGGSRN